LIPSRLQNFKDKVVNFDFWNSPTLMTWMSYMAKAVSLLGVLPLVLKQFTTGEVVLWYLFSSVIALQSLGDFGFRQVFSRVISFAYSGASDIGVLNKDSNVIEDNSNISECNVPLLKSIMSAQFKVYEWLTVGVFVLMSLFGSWSVLKPINDASYVLDEAWIAWGIIVVGSCISFYFRIYMNYLEGLNEIALVRRVEILTSLGAVVSSLLILIYSPSLLNLVIVNQFWLVVNSFRDWFLARKVKGGLFNEVSKRVDISNDFLRKIWGPAWRGGVGGLMSAGLTNLTSIIYAQLGSMGEAAAFLLAMRLITQVRDVSMAPFYSKLPLMSMLRAKNRISELTELAKKGMRLSHLVFVLGFLIVAVLLNPMLVYTQSQIEFVDLKLWSLIGLAFFFHRFGAMHIQVYLTTNHVISHIADGIAGLIYILSSLLLIRLLGVYTVPVGMLLGYFCFYCWYGTFYSLRSLGNISLWNFERQASMPAVIIWIIFLLFIYMFKWM
jgi:hypothetical protein